MLCIYSIYMYFMCIYNANMYMYTCTSTCIYMYVHLLLCKPPFSWMDAYAYTHVKWSNTCDLAISPMIEMIHTYKYIVNTYVHVYMVLYMYTIHHCTCATITLPGTKQTAVHVSFVECICFLGIMGICFQCTPSSLFMCMFLYTVYMHPCEYIHTHVHVHVHVYTCIYVHVYTNVHAHNV